VLGNGNFQSVNPRECSTKEPVVVTSGLGFGKNLQGRHEGRNRGEHSLPALLGLPTGPGTFPTVLSGFCKEDTCPCQRQLSSGSSGREATARPVSEGFPLSRSRKQILRKPDTLACPTRHRFTTKSPELHRISALLPPAVETADSFTRCIRGGLQPSLCT
jgi:hypothetical protein